MDGDHSGTEDAGPGHEEDEQNPAQSVKDGAPSNKDQAIQPEQSLDMAQSTPAFTFTSLFAETVRYQPPPLSEAFSHILSAYPKPKFNSRDDPDELFKVDAEFPTHSGSTKPKSDAIIQTSDHSSGSTAPKSNAIIQASDNSSGIDGAASNEMAIDPNLPTPETPPTVR